MLQNKQEWQNRAKIQVVGVHTVLKPVPDVTDACILPPLGHRVY
jgi:hypothetical protein